jgi:hypothetical protein
LPKAPARRLQSRFESKEQEKVNEPLKPAELFDMILKK